MPITHPFVHAIADGIDTSIVRPSNWNAGHTITGDIAVPGTVAIGANPAVVGDVRLRNAGYIVARNLANTADINLLAVNASNQIVIDDGAGSGLVWSKSSVAIGGTPAATGVIRIPNTTAIYARNVANTGDRRLIILGGADNIVVGDTGVSSMNLTTNGGTIFMDTSALAVGTTPAATGVIRIPNGTTIVARNGANTGDVGLLSLNASNQSFFNDNGTARPVSSTVADATGHLLANIRYWRAE